LAQWLGSARASRAVFSAHAEHTGAREMFKITRAHGAFESATRASLTAAEAAALPKKRGAKTLEKLFCREQSQNRETGYAAKFNA
jgi:hypothetical protein